MKRILVFGLLAFAVASVTRGTPYWVAWEGNDYPENEGWERIVNGPQPAERSLADGIMTMDGLADRQIDDYYRLDRPLNPAPAEIFILQWRVRVNRVDGHSLALYDPGLAIFSDEDNELHFVLGVDFIRSYHESGAVIPIAPGVFHSYEVRSPDMYTYDLMIDGALARTGEFWLPNFRRSGVDWGDYARGAASCADWDYVRFGVVPEPSTSVIVLFLLGLYSQERKHK